MRRKRRKKKEKEGKKKEKKIEHQQRLQPRTGLAGPATPRPQRACALAAARVRAVAEGRPAWAPAAARLRAVAEGHQGHGAAGMPRPHAGRRAFWRTATSATLSVGVSKWWPGRVLACFARRARLNMAFGTSAWSTVVSVSFDSTY